jgi:hypothetical protein
VQPSVDLQLSIEAGPDVYDEELGRLVNSLRSELLELDVERADSLAVGDTPDGARGVEALMLGALVVRQVRRPETLKSVVRAIRGWLRGHRGRRVRIELDGDVLELSSASDEEHDRLVTNWIERHAAR